MNLLGIYLSFSIILLFNTFNDFFRNSKILSEGDVLDTTIFGDDVEEGETDQTTGSSTLTATSNALSMISSSLPNVRTTDSSLITTTAAGTTPITTTAASTMRMEETTSGILQQGKWPLARPKRKSSRYQHIAYRHSDSKSIEESDRTVRCGRIRKQEKFYWLETRPQISIYCHPIQGRLQICDFVCSDSGRPPKTGPKHIKCYFFRDRVARLTNIKTIPQC